MGDIDYKEATENYVHFVSNHLLNKRVKGAFLEAEDIQSPKTRFLHSIISPSGIRGLLQVYASSLRKLQPITTLNFVINTSDIDYSVIPPGTDEQEFVTNTLRFLSSREAADYLERENERYAFFIHTLMQNIIQMDEQRVKQHLVQLGIDLTHIDSEEPLEPEEINYLDRFLGYIALVIGFKIEGCVQSVSHHLQAEHNPLTQKYAPDAAGYAKEIVKAHLPDIVALSGIQYAVLKGIGNYDQLQMSPKEKLEDLLEKATGYATTKDVSSFNADHNQEIREHFINNVCLVGLTREQAEVYLHYLQQS